MKNQIDSFLFLLILISFTSCGNYPPVGESKNVGAIIGDFEQTDCVSIGTYTGDACVVMGPLDFDTVAGSSCNLNIDFNTHSIIGKTISYGCNARIIRELEIDHIKKQYIYMIKYKESGLCKRLGFAFNLVLVPKVPNDYTVLFGEVKE